MRENRLMKPDTLDECSFPANAAAWKEKVAAAATHSPTDLLMYPMPIVQMVVTVSQVKSLVHNNQCAVLMALLNCDTGFPRDLWEDAVVEMAFVAQNASVLRAVWPLLKHQNAAKYMPHLASPFKQDFVHYINSIIPRNSLGHMVDQHSSWSVEVVEYLNALWDTKILHEEIPLHAGQEKPKPHKI